VVEEGKSGKGRVGKIDWGTQKAWKSSNILTRNLRVAGGARGGKKKKKPSSSHFPYLILPPEGKKGKNPLEGKGVFSHPVSLSSNAGACGGVGKENSAKQESRSYYFFVKTSLFSLSLRGEGSN